MTELKECITIQTDWEFLLYMCNKIENLKLTNPEVFADNPGNKDKKQLS